MKLRIISDGTRAGTRLIDENNEEVEGVIGIEWKFEHAEAVTLATIRIEGVGLEVCPKAEDAIL